ncbi:hypothetical protein RhiJN_23738 [Ceratobasidium sp. AG-Ba]|nr:hypothetical protein RhiJN_23738 [Ceratobasidium sp. AG-Ba]
MFATIYALLHDTFMLLSIVYSSDIERLLEIMRQGHEVTMQTYRDMIERWRADIEASHQKFLNEQEKIRARRERKREKPIHWQPGVNMW